VTDITKELLLQAKYARIITLIAQAKNVSTEDAMDIFYTSETLPLIEQGVADLHCRSDAYLTSLILDEPTAN
jgi:hypothetical protein